MANLYVKWAAFLIADGILFILLGASRYMWPFPPGIFPVPVPAGDAGMFVSAGIRAVYNYYSYGAFFIAVGMILLLARYIRNHSLKGIPVLENIVD